MLMEHGALSVSIEDAHADTMAEQAIFGEPDDPPPGIWQQNIVTAMLEADADVTALLATVQSELQLDGLKYCCEFLDESLPWHTSSDHRKFYEDLERILGDIMVRRQAAAWDLVLARIAVGASWSLVGGFCTNTQFCKIKSARFTRGTSQKK